MFAPVAPPRLAAPAHSLVRAAVTNLDGEASWQRGLTYAPDSPGGYRALSTGCTPEQFDNLLDGPVPVVDYQPWELEVEDTCHSTFGYDRAEVTARLDRAMLAVESYAIARELWVGDLAQETGDPNLYLAKAPTVLGSGAVSPKRGLGMLEAAAGDALRGGQVYLHIGREARPFFPELVKSGNLLLTNIDNMIVADAGYPGTPPDGVSAAANVAWVYATGPVVVRRGPIEHDPADAQIVDARTNTVTRRARRAVAAHFDLAAHFAVPITLS